MSLFFDAWKAYASACAAVQQWWLDFFLGLAAKKELDP